MVRNGAWEAVDSLQQYNGVFLEQRVSVLNIFLLLVSRRAQTKGKCKVVPYGKDAVQYQKNLYPILVDISIF